MLDGFHLHHSQLAFRDRKRLRLNEEAFKAAENAAVKSLDPPDRAFLNGNGSLERHQLFYEFHLAREMDAYIRDLQFQIDRTLVEVVILLQFLNKEGASELRDSLPVRRSIAVLGWMIQARLQHIILQTGDMCYPDLMKFSSTSGINSDVWEKRLVGATAEAKAMMQISRTRGLRLYSSTLVDDVVRGIDFFVETLDGGGACVSVKTDVGGYTRFLLESTTDYEEAWNRVERGSQDFREYAHRDWRPLLLLMGKARGGDFKLFQKSGRVSRWVTTLESILNGTATANNLVVTA